MKYPKEDLQRLHQELYRTLAEIIRVCEVLDIPYFIQGGTAIGALYNKGIVPWDDDVDLLIPREDYNRMIKLFKDSERYCLFAFDRNPDFIYPFAKLCDMTTRKDEFGYENGIELGVDIDLFPLDAWDDDLEKAKKEKAALKKQKASITETKEFRLSPTIDVGDIETKLKNVTKICVLSFPKALNP